VPTAVGLALTIAAFALLVEVTLLMRPIFIYSLNTFGTGVQNIHTFSHHSATP